MRLSSVIVLAVVAALESSIFATPVDTVAQHCYVMCIHDYQCNTCGPYGGYCSFPICYGLSTHWSGVSATVCLRIRFVALNLRSQLGHSEVIAQSECKHCFPTPRLIRKNLEQSKISIVGKTWVQGEDVFHANGMTPCTVFKPAQSMTAIQFLTRSGQDICSLAFNIQYPAKPQTNCIIGLLVHFALYSLQYGNQIETETVGRSRDEPVFPLRGLL
ncbi:hypothetical protein EDD22DRAFT_853325 [Suillus occidentalis]|nr:hypothetical protein EDD22DRAFT_853325 [Suillus occidentalis]